MFTIFGCLNHNIGCSNQSCFLNRSLYIIFYGSNHHGKIRTFCWFNQGFKQVFNQSHPLCFSFFFHFSVDSIPIYPIAKLVYNRNTYGLPLVLHKAVAEVSKKPIGEVGCCESRMAERTHWWIEKWLDCCAIYLSFSLSSVIYPLVFQFIHLSIYLSLPLFVYLSVFLSICLSVYPSCLSICLSVCMSIYLSVCLFIYLSVYLSIDLPVYPCTYLSFYLSVFLSIYLSVYLPICPSVYLSVKCALRHSAVHSFIISTSKCGPGMVCYCVLYILTWKCASRHNGVGVQFFISHLATWLRTRRFSEPTFRPPGATTHFRAPTPSFFWLFLFSSLIFFLLSSFFFFSSLLFSSLLSSPLLSSPLWLSPPLLVHLSILSEVWLQNFPRWMFTYTLHILTYTKKL